MGSRSGAGKSEEIVGRAWSDLPTKPLFAPKVFVKPEGQKDVAGAVQLSVE